MPITPAYFLGLELKHLRATVNASECWRALVASPAADYATLMALADAATSSEANGLAAIHKGDIAADNITYPLCMIDHLIDGDFTLSDTSGWHGERQYVVTIEHQIPTDYDSDIEEGQVYWADVVGRIVEEIIAAVRAAPGGLSDVERFSLSYGYGHQQDQGSGRYHGIARMVWYGHGEIS